MSSAAVSSFCSNENSSDLEKIEKISSDEIEFSSINSCIESIQRGSFVIVVDDIDRENEGDFIGASSLVTRESIALMLRHTSGVICSSISISTSEKLKLPLMVPSSSNADPYSTAFTVTCDYKHGTSTGISASDRAATIRALSSSTSSASDFTRPGHVFPLIAKQGGVLSRGGHTEAAMDLAKLAGAPGEGGFLCEVVNKETGEMLRLSNGLIKLSKELNLPLTSIDAIQRFRMRREQLVSFQSWETTRLISSSITETPLSSSLSSSSSSSFGMHFKSLFCDNQSISVTVLKSRKRVRTDLDKEKVKIPVDSQESVEESIEGNKDSNKKVFVKVIFPDVESLIPSSSSSSDNVIDSLFSSTDLENAIEIHLIYPGKPFFDTKVASIYANTHTDQTKRRVIDKSSTSLFPPNQELLDAFKKVSLYDEYSVCDRVSAEIAQVIRFVLQVEKAGINIEDDESRLQDIHIEPMYDELKSKEGDNSIIHYTEDSLLINLAKDSNRWPEIYLDTCKGLPLPRLWEWGISCNN
jgi:3,4-dihydroxy-2-butanone 4-phosphate synthase